MGMNRVALFPATGPAIATDDRREMVASLRGRPEGEAGGLAAYWGRLQSVADRPNVFR